MIPSQNTVFYICEVAVATIQSDNTPEVHAIAIQALAHTSSSKKS